MSADNMRCLSTMSPNPIAGANAGKRLQFSGKSEVVSSHRPVVDVRQSTLHQAMNPEMPKEFKKWEVTRQKGKKKFILQTGVLAWGLPMFVVMTFFVNRQRGTALSLRMILLSAVIWAIGGACFGWAMWNVSEKKYQKYLATKKSE